MKRLLVHNHEPRSRQRRHIRRAVSVFRSLVDAEVVEVLDEPDELGRPVRVNLDLQDDFRLNQPLGLFVVEAVSVLDPEASDYHLQVLSVVESVLEDPMVMLLAQRDRARDELMNRMKAEGVEYTERMERLAEVTWPQPEVEFVEPAFNVFARNHPWVGYLRPSPKSVVREMFEVADTFNQYVSRYGLKRSEGLLLRYLTDCYKALIQTVPSDAVNDNLGDVIEWLAVMVRQVDSSLIDEWERFRNPDIYDDLSEEAAPPEVTDITANRRAFNVMVRNEVFVWVQLLARRDHSTLVERLAGSIVRGGFGGVGLLGLRGGVGLQGGPGFGSQSRFGRSDGLGGRDDARVWSEADLDEAMAGYWAEHDWIGIDTEARATHRVIINDDTGRVTQTLIDPDGYCEWVIDAEVDLPKSRAYQQAVVSLLAIRRL